MVLSKLHIICFANTNSVFLTRAYNLKCHFQKLKVPLDNFTIYTEKNLHSFKGFYDLANKNKIGYGLWAWKPFIIWNHMKKIENGDRLIYVDTGIEASDSMYNRIENLLDEADIYVQSTTLFEKDYSKPFFLESLKATPYEKNTFQYKATIIGILKSKKTTNFIESWLDTCSSNNFLHLRNDHNFPMHRHDQSVFSLLLKRFRGRVRIQKEMYPLRMIFIANWSPTRSYSLIDAKNKTPCIRVSKCIICDFLVQPVAYLLKFVYRLKHE